MNMKNTIINSILSVSAIYLFSCASVNESAYANYDMLHKGSVRSGRIHGQTSFLKQEIGGEVITGEASSYSVIGIAVNGDVYDMAINNALTQSHSDGMIVTRKSVERVGFMPFVWTTKIKVFGRPIVYNQAKNDSEALDQKSLKLMNEIALREAEKANLWNTYMKLRGRGGSVSVSSSAVDFQFRQGSQSMSGVRAKGVCNARVGGAFLNGMTFGLACLPAAKRNNWIFTFCELPLIGGIPNIFSLANPSLCSRKSVN